MACNLKIINELIYIKLSVYLGACKYEVQNNWLWTYMKDLENIYTAYLFKCFSYIQFTTYRTNKIWYMRI